MDRLREMEAFVRIVERGSLTAAADALNVSLPTMVRTLASAEKRLRTRLLQRTTRRIALTEEGREFYERSRRILAEVQDADASLGAAVPRGLLRITVPVTFGRMHVQPVVLEFMRKYPEVQVELLMNDRNLDLIDDRLDLAVRFGELPDSSQVAFALGAVRPVFCASPRYLARVGIPAHPQDLEHHVCTRFTGFARLREWTFHKGEEVLKVPVAGAFRCNLEQNLLDACVDGFGIGRFLSYVVAPMVASRRLKLVLEDYAPPPWPVNLLAPRTQLLPARTRLMLEWLRKKLSRRLAACRI